VYEEQSTTSNTSRPAPASGRLADLVVPPLSDGGSQSRGEDAVKVAHRTSPDTGSATAGAAAAPALAGEDIDAAADAEEPVAVPASDILTPSPIADRRDDQPGSPGGDGHGNGLDGRSVDRELQRLIGDGPRNEGLGNGKASKGLDERSIDRELQRLGRNAPVTPAPGLPDTEDDVPVDAPAPAAQTPGAPPAPTAPAPPPPAVADPATPADPDAVLDDTPAGELDQTDLGGQVDEADPAGAAPAAAPAAPAPAPALPAPEPAAPAPAPTEVAPATAPVDAPAPAQAAPA
jgi:2-oxoglutarate dehydrogenase E2 component (dihydrolipoamide succinyltransferase)